MARRTVGTTYQTYTVAPDDPRRAGQRLWAIARGRLLDELTQRPILTRITVDTNQEGLVPRSVARGIAGLVGTPERVFSFINAAANTYDLAVNAQHFTVIFGAEGYLPYETEIALGPVPGFPEVFVPAPAVVIEMHRQPIVIRGRVVRKGSTPTPVVGLIVEIDAIWRGLPAVTTGSPPDSNTVMALQPGIHFPRAAVVTQLRRRELVEVPGEDKALLEDADARSERIRCSDRVNLSPGNILAIEVGDPHLTEYMMIDAIDGAGTANQPAEISLAYPLAYAHRRHAVVRRVNQQPSGADNPFRVDAIPGDSTVLLGSTTDLGGARTVEIADGTQPNEYRRIFPYSTSTDGGGYFQFPPLHRVAQLNLHLYGNSLSIDLDEFIPDYNSRENWIEVVV